MIGWGKLFNAYKKDKNPPYFDDVAYIRMACELLIDYMVCNLLDNDTITGYVICCARRHFLPFLPFSSRTMPPSWEMLSAAKTPENSTFPLFHMKMRYLSHDNASQSYTTKVV